MRENLEIIFKLPLKLKGFMPIAFLWMIEYDQSTEDDFSDICFKKKYIINR